MDLIATWVLSLVNAGVALLGVKSVLASRFGGGSVELVVQLLVVALPSCSFIWFALIRRTRAAWTVAFASSTICALVMLWFVAKGEWAAAVSGGLFCLNVVYLLRRAAAAP